MYKRLKDMLPYCNGTNELQQPPNVKLLADCDKRHFFGKYYTKSVELVTNCYFKIYHNNELTRD